MKYLLGLFLLILIAHPVHATNEGAVAVCLEQTTSAYTEQVEKCIADLGSDEALLLDSDAYSAAIADCNSADGYNTYLNELSACYDDADFGPMWDTDVLKESLSNVYNDAANISADQGLELAECLEKIDETFDLSGVPDARAQQAISDCYAAIGFNSAADVYEKTAIVVDCAEESLDVNGFADITELMANPSKEDEAYISQCVIERTAPVIAGLAILNIPFIGGFQGTILFGQFVLTQPLMLLRRRKYKTWGRVFDAFTNEPIDLASIRLSDAKTDRVVRSAVTNKRGEYLLLVNPGQYVIEAIKNGYRFPSVLADGGKKQVDVKTEHDVVDRQLPLDPAGETTNIFRYRTKKLLKRIGWVIGLVAPFLSAAALLFVRAGWVWWLFALHILLLLVFLRVAPKQKTKKFGKVTAGSKGLSGAVVSVYKKPYDKRIAYTVSDMFGRYVLPVAVGSFTLTFEKKGFTTRQLDVNVTESQLRDTTLHIDIELKQ